MPGLRAAGAIVWREVTPLELQVLLVHRPKYDDWSFAKGTLEEGESALAAAYREVKEETGLDTVFGQFVGTTSYVSEDHKKKVKYWMARAIDSDQPFAPNNEIDAIEWLDIKAARERLSYEEDRELLKDFKKLERHANVLIFLRHGKAIKRGDWSDYDIDRPLAELGFAQAQKMAKHFAPFHLDGIYTSDAMRCFATVEPMSVSMGLSLNVSRDFNEETFENTPKRTTEYAKQLLKYPGNNLVCGHNPVIPHAISEATGIYDLSGELEPADAWVVHHLGDQIISITFMSQPTT